MEIRFGKNARYWIIVASKNHVMRGVKGGFCQANHRKASSLRRMRKGDGILFYSPKETFEGSEKCHKFTAIGSVKDDEIYRIKMSEDFMPFRRRINFYKSKEAEIEPLLDSLTFIRNKKAWGFVMRFGFIEIPYVDFSRIAKAMDIVLSPSPSYFKQCGLTNV